MTSNFALSLSADGIRLSHKTPTGWSLVGEVDVQSPDLVEELAALRKTAVGLAPEGLRCKLVIPDSQIRYLEIETPGATEPEREAAARRALEGATPYAVSDLVIDTRAAGDTTQIAAVARETLEEAEAFALQHRLTPVSMVATPDAAIFDGEPYFGPARTAAEPDMPEKPISSTEATPEPAPVHAAEPKDPADNALAEPVEPDDGVSDASENPDDQVESGFVSVRRVPTFRTGKASGLSGLEGATDGAVPDFGAEEPNAPSQKPGASPGAVRDVVKSATPPVSTSQSEAERLTVFGARAGNGIGGAMRRAGVIASVSVFVIVLIAGLSSGTVRNTVTGLFAGADAPEAPRQFAEPLVPEMAQTLPDTSSEQTETESPEIELAAFSTELTDEDTAVLEALRAPVAPTPEETARQIEETAQADYAVTGIWPIAPDVPNPPPLVDIENLYVPSIDPINPNFDAVALPDTKDFSADQTLLELASPAPAGTNFVLDDRGFVVPTPEGALNPDGVRVFAGSPPVRQPDKMPRIEEPGEDLAVRLLLSGFRPKSRPADLQETTERATLSGLTRSELGALRPRLRPQSAQESAQESALAAASLVRLEGSGSDAALVQPGDENAFDGATARAVAASLRPDARPNNFSAIVARVQREQREQQKAAPAPQPAVTTASAAPRAVAPRIPSSASASREATVRNAINLRKVNLIGVYGKPSSRRALVRLGNGSYRKVEVGDRIDGGRVSAIGDSELRYQKSGRAIVLKMPQG